MAKTSTIKVFILFLLSVLPLSAKGKLFEASTFYLDNGMQVILIENHKSPIIKHMVWYKNGASDELYGNGGSAHLLEHLMFRGTKDFRENRFDEIMNENGVVSNAFTAQDYTAYHQFADVSKLELLMFLEADRMRNLNISDENFIKEREVVYQERQQEVETKPTAMFMEKLRRKLWGDHPYARPVSGTSKEIKSLQKQDVINYYERFYTPQNAVLVLSGDIDLDTAQDLAQKYYGAIENSMFYKKAPVYLLKNLGYSELKVYDKKVQNARVVYVFAVPSYNLNKKSALVLDILEEYFGAEKSSPLYKELVENEKIAVGLGANNGFSARRYDTFSVSMVLSENSDEYAKEAAQKLKAAIKNALIQITPEQFEAAKKRILANLVYVSDNAQDAAYIVGSMVTAGMKVEDAVSYDEQIKAVTFMEFKTEVENALGYAPAVMGFLLPAENREELEDGEDEEAF